MHYLNLRKKLHYSLLIGMLAFQSPLWAEEDAEDGVAELEDFTVTEISDDLSILPSDPLKVPSVYRCLCSRPLGPFQKLARI